MRTCVDIVLVETLVEILVEEVKYLETLVHVHVDVLDGTIHTIEVL